MKQLLFSDSIVKEKDTYLHIRCILISEKKDDKRDTFELINSDTKNLKINDIPKFKRVDIDNIGVYGYTKVLNHYYILNDEYQESLKRMDLFDELELKQLIFKW